LGTFLQNKGKLVIERGDENEDVNRTIMGGISMLVTEHCESRPQPYPGLMKVIDSFDVLGLLVFVRFVALVDRWSSPQTCKWSCTWMQQILKRAKGLTKLHTGSKPGFSVGAASVGKRSIRN
jgi:hypothetical protein